VITAGNIKPDKEKSTERIDGAVALIMALDRALRHRDDGGGVYNDRGITFTYYLLFLHPDHNLIDRPDPVGGHRVTLHV